MLTCEKICQGLPETMTIDFTIAICTYNGEHRLPEVLDCLQSQVGTDRFNWEIIIVDNNSTDNTAKLVQAYQAIWSYPFPLCYTLENQQGAGFARKHAVSKARGKLIGFLDDDNLPAPDWVANAYTFGQANPHIGAYGSQIHGQFEVTPPQEFKRILPFLAIVERGSAPLQYHPAKRVLPPSAGLVVRKQVWLNSVPERCVLEGRTNTSMLTGEDTEVLAHIQQSGWEIWYNPAMRMHHKIPRWRLEKDYLIPFFRGIGLSRYVTRRLSVQPWQRPLAFFIYMANDLRKISFHLLKHGTKVKTDLVATCEMTLFVHSLISPFYIWRKQYLEIARK